MFNCLGLRVQGSGSCSEFGLLRSGLGSGVKSERCKVLGEGCRV